MSVRVQSENESRNENKTNNFHIYCEELEWRSDDELRFKVEQLVQSEKMSIARLIAHLSEIGGKSSTSNGATATCSCASTTSPPVTAT